MENETIKSHRKLIEDIGSEEIRVITGASNKTIWTWKNRGIPWKHRNKIAQHAIIKGFAVPEGFAT